MIVFTHLKPTGKIVGVQQSIDTNVIQISNNFGVETKTFNVQA